MAARKSKNHVETEEKICLSRDDLEKVLERLKDRALQDSFRHKYVPRPYFDTAKLQLHRRGLSLRVQYATGKKGNLGSYEQTFKCDVKKKKRAGIRRRYEIRDAIPSHLPDIGACNDVNTRELLKDIPNKKLKHIFTASIERRLFDLSMGEAGKVEMAFDCGVIYLADDPQQSVAINEIEIEIKKGPVSLINEVRKAILEIAPSATIQPLSKAEQGVALYCNARKNKKL